MKAKLLFCALSFLLVSGAVRGVMGQVLGQPYRLSDKEVEAILRRVEKQADNFRKSLHDSLNRSRFDKTRREDDINAYVKDFYQETARLRDHFNHHRSTAPDVESVLDRAARIDGFVTRYRLDPRAEDDWAALKTSLDELAQAFNVSWRWGGYQPVGPVSPVSPVEPIGPVSSGIPYRLSDKEVEEIIHRVEKQSDRFRSSLDSALDKSRFDGTRREDDINTFVKDFYQETKRLRDHFDSHKSTAADMQSVLDRGARIDEFMRRNRLSNKAQNDWASLRTYLDELASAYNVSWRWR